MKVYLLLFTLILLAQFTTIAQAPDTMWMKVYGGIGKEQGFAVDLTDDGGYIVSGFTNSFGIGSDDFWLLKTDGFGDTLWTKIYGGELNEGSFSVHQTIEGGYILSGYTDSFGSGESNFWLIKTDENGDTIWSRTYDYNDIQWCRYSEQTSDSGYILVGFAASVFPYYSDIWLVKTNKGGDTVWTKKYGGAEFETSSWVEQTSDGGYILVGTTKSFGSGDSDLWLIKTNDVGDTIWTRTIGGIGPDVGYSVRQTADEGFIICGSTESIGAGKSDVWILKVNTVGDTVWTKVLGGNESEYSICIQQTKDGGYIAAGYTYSYGHGDSDVWIIKLNENGILEWDKIFGGLDTDLATYVKQTIDGGFVLTGYTNSFGFEDLWILKIGPDSVLIMEDKDFGVTEYILKQNYPNPFNPVTSIQYSIPKRSKVVINVYDILGNEVATLVNEEKDRGVYTITFDGSGLASGMYLYRFQAGSFVETRRMVLMK